MDKIVCFGKNYSDHMMELGDAPVSQPVIFLKPPSVLKQCAQWGETLQAHLTEHETHYECELVIKLNTDGYRMTLEEASDAIDEYTIGLDMTLRQQQTILKQNGHPWTTAKVFSDSAIIGPWIKYNEQQFLNTSFQFMLDQDVKQQSQGKNMLFKPRDLVHYASQFFPLCAGDILFTGTPAGVGAVKNGSIGSLIINYFQYYVRWSTIVN